MNAAAENIKSIDVLFKLCLKGENSAFNELYSRYSSAMFSVCMRLLNNREEAEDCLQESFINAFKKLGSLKDSSMFGSWLKRIVINNCLDVLKKKKLVFSELGDIDSADSIDQSEEEEFYDTEVIKKAIQQLPDGYRVILTLYLFEDCTHQQIAEKLNISAGTSKSQYSRARKKLSHLIRLTSYGR